MPRGYYSNKLSAVWLKTTSLMHLKSDTFRADSSLKVRMVRIMWQPGNEGKEGKV